MESVWAEETLQREGGCGGLLLRRTNVEKKLNHVMPQLFFFFFFVFCILDQEMCSGPRTDSWTV